jgi:SAM-dependent methyltransferase
VSGAPPLSYDLIADVYETDMGGNLPFDDAAFYRAICAGGGGPALELGCGTGRVLLPLVASGLRVVGIDRSGPMLRRLREEAKRRGLAAAVARMDARAPGLRGRFATVIAPFSMVTYLPDPPDLDAVLAAAGGLLLDGGRLVLDAFIPRDVSGFAQPRRDYRRPHGAGWLERHRRITPLGDGTNRVERRYRLEEEGTVREWTTVERIRPYTMQELEEAGARHGYVSEARVLDYGATGARSAQFATLVLRWKGAPAEA